MKTLKFMCLLFLVTFSANASDKFYPKADATVYSEKFWTDIEHKGDSNEATTRFRIIYEAPADLVFEHLINTNAFYKIHSSYTDSRCLTEKDFEKIIESKPEDPDQLVQLIQNKRYTTLINRKPGKKWTDYWYTRINLPWPLSDKWAVQKAKVDESNSHKNEYRVEYKMHHGNLESLKGWWEVLEVPGKPGWTEFRGESQSDPGIAVPKFIAKKSFNSTLRKEFETNQKLLNTKTKS